jgi:hypothetical protein
VPHHFLARGSYNRSAVIIKVSRKHWVVFGLVLAVQIFAVWASAARMRLVWGPQYLVVAGGVVVLRPKHWFGWETLAILIASSAFVEALIIVNLWETLVERTSQKMRE